MTHLRPQPARNHLIYRENNAYANGSRFYVFLYLQLSRSGICRHRSSRAGSDLALAVFGVEFRGLALLTLAGANQSGLRDG